MGLHGGHLARKGAPAPSGRSTAAAATEPKHSSAAAPSRREYWHVVGHVLETLVVVAAGAVLVSSLLVPVLRIYGTSMTPDLEEGDLVAAIKGKSFTTGDVIAFYYGNNVLVKRVIAGPGDWVDIAEDGTVSVNGTPLDEPYLTDKAYGQVDIDLPYQVPDGRWFVMGDHRSTSADSRTKAVGCVSEEQVVGKVWLRVWPFERMGVLS